MLVEKSVAVVVFRREAECRFLILFRKGNENYKDVWEFPKGFVETGEGEMQTASRELQEETGLTEKDIHWVPEYHDKISFFFRDSSQDLVRKEVTFLMAQTTKTEVNLSSEHNAYRWAPYLEGFDLLKAQKSYQDILKRANEFVKRKFRQKMLF
ncbi:MAG: NUDIX domain-containing protein [Candidatus Pacearchaeota archaeon]|nr:NUDIX domain-containing protein [Candidatus Pacearchaeota archaeon]